MKYQRIFFAFLVLKSDAFIINSTYISKGPVALRTAKSAINGSPANNVNMQWEGQLYGREIVHSLDRKVLILLYVMCIICVCVWKFNIR